MTLLDRPTTAPAAARRPSLIRAEARRFVSRRFIRVILVLVAIGYLAGAIWASTQFSKPTADVLADATAKRAGYAADNERWRQECLAETSPSGPRVVFDDSPSAAKASAPSAATPEERCGPAMTAEDLGPIQNFIDKPMFNLATDGPGGVLFLSFAGAAVAFLLGATFVGAEWSSRSLVAQLFWAPRRLRVMGAKLAVLSAVAVVFGGLLQAAGYLENRWLASAKGTTEVPKGFWGDYAAMAGRGILFTLVAALVGFALANAIRNTAAALGIGFVYFAIVESVIRAFKPAWQQWLFTDNAVAWVQQEKYTIYREGLYRDDTGRLVQGSYEQVVTHAHAGTVLAVVAAVLVAIGVALFAKRDLN
ncbi:MAG: ABC transporter permease subunit [Sporichthyaceae bacterium]